MKCSYRMRSHSGIGAFNAAPDYPCLFLSIRCDAERADALQCMQVTCTYQLVGAGYGSQSSVTSSITVRQEKVLEAELAVQAQSQAEQRLAAEREAHSVTERELAEARKRLVTDRLSCSVCAKCIGLVQVQMSELEEQLQRSIEVFGPID